MYKNVVIVDEAKGIFVGEGLGLAFWSKLDAVGQSMVPTFETEGQAKTYISECEMPLEEINSLKFVNVVTANEFYASIDELVVAGLAPDLGNLGEVLTSKGMTLH